jgi:hypothetical protein
MMRIAATSLKALSIMLLAAYGTMMVHHNGLIEPNSFGLALGVFALVGAFLLYRIFFWRQ